MALIAYNTLERKHTEIRQTPQSTIIGSQDNMDASCTRRAAETLGCQDTVGNVGLPEHLGPLLMEHGWDEEGVFNLEGGCYAKMIDLNPVKEPLIHAAIRRDAILENVVLTPDGRCDYKDGSRTENTRGSYPMWHIPNHEPSGKAGHAANVIFLACDAFGVLPPVSKLTTEQALYHLVSGYTAKVAGTEQGITEPTATFSTCFGGAFMPLPPRKYAELFKKKLQDHKTTVYLVNTGWTGGAYGVGKRME